MAGNMERSSRFPKGLATHFERTDVDNFEYESCDSQDGSFPNEPVNLYGSHAHSGYLGVLSRSDGESSVNTLNSSQAARPCHRDAGSSSHAEPGSVGGQFPSETGLGCGCRGCVSGTLGQYSDREHIGYSTSTRRYGIEESIAGVERSQFRPGTNPYAAYAVNVDTTIDVVNNTGPRADGTSRSPFANPYAEYALHRPWGTESRYYHEQ